MEGNTLSLAGQGLSSARAVQRFRGKLTCADLGSNKIFSVGKLDRPELEELNLEKNSLVDVRHFTGLANLRVLNVSRNSIHSVDGLDSLRHLEVLNLSHNFINSISPSAFSDNRKLRHLDLAGNRITALFDLSRNMHLETLLLSSNSISDLHNARTLIPSPCLHTFDVRRNKISEVSEFGSLSHLKALASLKVDENPLCGQHFDHALFLVHRLPQLRFVDSIEVTKEQREKSREIFRSAPPEILAPDVDNRKLVAFLTKACPTSKSPFRSEASLTSTRSPISRRRSVHEAETELSTSVDSKASARSNATGARARVGRGVPFHAWHEDNGHRASSANASGTSTTRSSGRASNIEVEDVESNPFVPHQEIVRSPLRKRSVHDSEEVITFRPRRRDLLERLNSKVRASISAKSVASRDDTSVVSSSPRGAPTQSSPLFKLMNNRQQRAVSATSDTGANAASSERSSSNSARQGPDSSPPGRTQRRESLVFLRNQRGSQTASNGSALTSVQEESHSSTRRRNSHALSGERQAGAGSGSLEELPEREQDTHSVSDGNENPGILPERRDAGQSTSSVNARAASSSSMQRSRSDKEEVKVARQLLFETPRSVADSVEESCAGAPQQQSMSSVVHVEEFRLLQQRMQDTRGYLKRMAKKIFDLDQQLQQERQHKVQSEKGVTLIHEDLLKKYQNPVCDPLLRFPTAYAGEYPSMEDDPDGLMENVAAEFFQARWKGALTRKRFARYQRYVDASAVIQAHWRGYKVRKSDLLPSLRIDRNVHMIKYLANRSAGLEASVRRLSSELTDVREALDERERRSVVLEEAMRVLWDQVKTLRIHDNIVQDFVESQSCTHSNSKVSQTERVPENDENVPRNRRANMPRPSPAKSDASIFRASAAMLEKLRPVVDGQYVRQRVVEHPRGHRDRSRLGASTESLPENRERVEASDDHPSRSKSRCGTPVELRDHRRGDGREVQHRSVDDHRLSYSHSRGGVQDRSVSRSPSVSQRRGSVDQYDSGGHDASAEVDTRLRSTSRSPTVSRNERSASRSPLPQDQRSASRSPALPHNERSASRSPLPQNEQSASRSPVDPQSDSVSFQDALHMKKRFSDSHTKCAESVFDNECERVSSSADFERFPASRSRQEASNKSDSELTSPGIRKPFSVARDVGRRHSGSDRSVLHAQTPLTRTSQSQRSLISDSLSELPMLSPMSRKHDTPRSRVPSSLDTRLPRTAHDLGYFHDKGGEERSLSSNSSEIARAWHQDDRRAANLNNLGDAAPARNHATLGRGSPERDTRHNEELSLSQLGSPSHDGTSPGRASPRHATREDFLPSSAYLDQAHGAPSESSRKGRDQGRGERCAPSTHNEPGELSHVPAAEDGPGERSAPFRGPEEERESLGSSWIHVEASRSRGGSHASSLASHRESEYHHRSSARTGESGRSHRSSGRTGESYHQSSDSIPPPAEGSGLTSRGESTRRHRSPACTAESDRSHRSSARTGESDRSHRSSGRTGESDRHRESSDRIPPPGGGSDLALRGDSSRRHRSPASDCTPSPTTSSSLERGRQSQGTTGTLAPNRTHEDSRSHGSPHDENTHQERTGYIPSSSSSSSDSHRRKIQDISSNDNGSGPIRMNELTNVRSHSDDSNYAPRLQEDSARTTRSASAKTRSQSDLSPDNDRRKLQRGGAHTSSSGSIGVDELASALSHNSSRTRSVVSVSLAESVLSHSNSLSRSLLSHSSSQHSQSVSLADSVSSAEDLHFDVTSLSRLFVEVVQASDLSITRACGNLRARVTFQYSSGQTELVPPARGFPQWRTKFTFQVRDADDFDSDTEDQEAPIRPKDLMTFHLEIVDERSHHLGECAVDIAQLAHSTREATQRVKLRLADKKSSCVNEAQKQNGEIELKLLWLRDLVSLSATDIASLGSLDYSKFTVRVLSLDFTTRGDSDSQVSGGRPSFLPRYCRGVYLSLELEGTSARTPAVPIGPNSKEVSFDMEFTFDVPSRDDPQSHNLEAQLSQSDFLLKLVATSSAPERNDALGDTLASVEDEPSQDMTIAKGVFPIAKYSDQTRHRATISLFRSTSEAFGRRGSSESMNATLLAMREDADGDASAKLVVGALRLDLLWVHDLKRLIMLQRNS